MQPLIRCGDQACREQDQNQSNTSLAWLQISSAAQRMPSAALKKETFIENGSIASLPPDA
jgi:hypothetical protein